MINLNDNLFMGEGSHRAAYRHPDDESKCLKIVKEGSLGKRRRTKMKWYKRLRKLSSFDETHKDRQAYKAFGTNPKKWNTSLASTVWSKPLLARPCC